MLGRMKGIWKRRGRTRRALWMSAQWSFALVNFRTPTRNYMEELNWGSCAKRIWFWKLVNELFCNQAVCGMFLARIQNVCGAPVCWVCRYLSRIIFNGLCHEMGATKIYQRGDSRSTRRWVSCHGSDPRQQTHRNANGWLEVPVVVLVKSRTLTGRLDWAVEWNFYDAQICTCLPQTDDVSLVGFDEIHLAVIPQ